MTLYETADNFSLGQFLNAALQTTRDVLVARQQAQQQRALAEQSARTELAKTATQTAVVTEAQRKVWLYIVVGAVLLGALLIWFFAQRK
jgi:uncharacterized membrane protein YgcG